MPTRSACGLHVPKSRQLVPGSGRMDPAHFGDLRALLAALDFEERIKGSHHIFTLEGREAALNLQSVGPKANAYQVRQVRQIIIEHRLASDEEDE